MEANELLKLCRVSMCEPIKETDTDYLDKSSPLGGGTNRKFVVEFGCKNFALTVKPGQTISEDDILGYMNGKPVRSKLRGKILEVYSNYFIGEYSSDIDGELLKYLGEGGAEKIAELGNLINNLKPGADESMISGMIGNVTGNFTGDSAKGMFGA